MFKTFVSNIYCFFYLINKKLYQHNIKKSFSSGTTVISIGNLTVGGTGKTPMVESVSGILSTLKINHSIVSGGYKRKINSTVCVSNGEDILCDVRLGGDEGFMLARSLPLVPVFVGKKLLALKLAYKNFKKNYIILDDGFQTKKIERNCDIVLIDLSVSIDDYRLLPAGKLREPLEAIQRAHIVIYTKANYDSGDSKKIKALFNQYIIISRPLVLESSYIAQLKKFCFHKQLFLSCNSAVCDDVVAFCGIANSKLFKSDALKKFKNVKYFKSFSDHHNYTNKDIKKIKNALAAFSVSSIVTTKKDFYKIQPFFKNYSIYIIDVIHEINNLDQLTEKLNSLD